MQRRKAWEDYPAPVVDTETGCLRWQGPHDKAGYGRINGIFRVHRVAWEREVGPIPEDHVVDHVAARGCRWKDCVLIDHLEPVLQAENARRAPHIVAQLERIKCPQGHAYTPENTYMHPRGKRVCRQCGRDSAARYRRKQAA